MTLQHRNSSPEHRRPPEPPEPVGTLALAVALAACGLWLDRPATAIEIFLAVLALFIGARRQ